MASRRSRHRRFLLPAVLAAVLVGEITGIALARTINPVELGPIPPASVAAPASATLPGLVLVRQPDVIAGTTADAAAAAAAAAREGAEFRTSVATPSSAAPSARHLPPAVSPRRSVAGASPSHVRAPTSTNRPSRVSYVGRNRVWIPSLGIDRSVQSFPCSRNRPPDAGVYRWGCAGRNNVYLMAHAWSAFKPLHDAYARGRLRTGMRVVYADGGGRVHTYRVIWWRVVAPTTAASWAWAALSRPGMTLQTCVGANSAYRLMVRLTQVG